MSAFRYAHGPCRQTGTAIALANLCSRRGRAGRSVYAVRNRSDPARRLSSSPGQEGGRDEADTRTRTEQGSRQLAVAEVSAAALGGEPEGREHFSIVQTM